jgi:hypothetical protein
MAAEEHGSRPIGRRVRLPEGAQEPITVHINGIAQTEGKDYKLVGNQIVFARPIVKEHVSRARWLAMFLGLFGSYGRNETIDVEYQRAGRTELASDVPVIPD